MKKFSFIFFMILPTLSMAGNYDNSCARRYIDAAEDLVEIAKQFNKGEITQIKYASAVTEVDAVLIAQRVKCISEAEEAKKCVEKTKPSYKLIRAKMDNISEKGRKVKVSDLDMVRMLKGVFVCPSL